MPYFVFSLFHALTFTRTTLMPRFLPPGPPAAAGGPPQPHHLAKRLQLWVKGMSYNLLIPLPLNVYILQPTMTLLCVSLLSPSS
jgi:hypothetical protein